MTKPTNDTIVDHVDYHPDEYRQIFESLEDVYIRTNDDGIIQLMSPSSEALFGQPISKMMGTQLANLYVNPIERQTLLNDVASDGVRRNFRTKMISASGRVIHVLISSKRFTSSDGSQGIQSIFRDISEFRKTEKQLEKSQTLLDALLGSFPDEVYFKNTKGEYIRTSTSMAKKHGRKSQQDLEGVTDYNLLDKDKANGSYARDSTIMLTGQSILDHIEEVNLPNGKSRWESSTRMPLISPTGRTIGTFGITHDITEQIRIQEELIEGRERFKATFEQAAVGIAHIGIEGKFIRINKKSQEILGYTSAELIGKGSLEFIHSDDAKKAQLIIDQLITGEISQVTMENRYERKDGTMIWARVTSSLVRNNETNAPMYRISVLEDISKIKESEERLSEQRHLMESIIQQSSEGIAAIDNEMNFILWNEMAVNFIGPEIQGNSGKWYKNYKAYRSDKSRLLSVDELPFVKALKEERIVRSQMFVQNESNKNGILLNVNASPLKDTQGQTLGCIAILSDVTESIMVNEKLIKSETKFRNLIENAPDGFIITDLSGNITLVNSQAEKLLGYERLQLLQFRIYVFFEEGILLHENIHELIADKEQKQISKITCIRGDDSTFFASLSMGLLDTDGDQLLSFSIKDITEQVANEAAVKMDIFNAEDRERTRIAHDLHDGLGQSIAAAYLFINSLTGPVNEALDPATAQRFNTCVELINKSVLETRLISHNIMPSSLRHFGLKQALDELIINLNTIHESIKISFKGYNLKGQRFDEKIELALYRATQELISNTLKHSRGDRLSIALSAGKTYLTLSTADNGVGFNVEKYTSGLGMESVKNRIYSFNGRINIDSAPGEGTKFKIQIPINQE